MKAVCDTSCENPSVSLLRSICYSTEAKVSTAATRCNHEKIARKGYEKYSQYQHDNVKVEDCGLFLSEEYPHLMAQMALFHVTVMQRDVWKSNVHTA